MYGNSSRPASVEPRRAKNIHENDAAAVVAPLIILPTNTPGCTLEQKKSIETTEQRCRTRPNENNQIIDTPARKKKKITNNNSNLDEISNCNHANNNIENQKGQQHETVSDAAALSLSGTSVECNELEQLRQETSEKTRSSNSSSKSSHHTVCTDIAGGNTHQQQQHHFESTNLCDGSQQLDSTDSEDKNNSFDPLFSIGTGFDDEPVTTCFENNKKLLIIFLFLIIVFDACYASLRHGFY